MFRTKATWDMKRDCVAEWASESGEVRILYPIPNPALTLALTLILVGL